MDNPSGQEREGDAEAKESRKLNMEEKRKLEKLLMADIDSATSRCDAISREEREALVTKLKRTPSAEVKKAYQHYKIAVRQRDIAEKALNAIGYCVTYDGNLSVNSRGTLPEQLVGFDDGAEEMRQKLASLKRSYVIRLFADHADTQSLFGSLAADLQRLVG